MPDVTVPAAPALSRIDRVELVHAGSWDISTGPWTVDADDLAAAVGALDCPAVRRPVLKLGHTDPRFDGEPAVGWIDNLATTEDGQTLVGDYVGMPGWLGGVIASAFPDRSVEGLYGFQCQIGHTHPFVLTAVALLGVTPPGVGTLGSLQDVAALYGVAAAADPGDAVSVALTVHASAPAHTGAMIALIPSAADAERLAVDGGEPAGELHTTLMYLGDGATFDPAQRNRVIDAVRGIAAGAEDITADGFAVSVFNPTNPERDTCIVLGLSGPVADIHQQVTDAVNGLDLPDLPEQHTPWLPHITLLYTDDVTQAAELVDRAGPVLFDRVRVAFAGETTDIPLLPATEATVAAAPRSELMPNPRPQKVAAGVSTEDVRRSYYENAPWSHWIVEFELDPLQLIVMDDDSGKRFRVAVAIEGQDSFSFGDPVEVVVRYVDAEAGAVAASTGRLVFASRAESRPGDDAQASNSVVEEPAPPADPSASENTDSPAAEPDPINEKEERVSDDIRSLLGVPEDADDAAMAAAIAELKAKATQPNPEPDADLDPEPQKQPELVGASAKPDPALEEMRREIQRLSGEVAASKAEKAATVKASVFDQAVKAGKISPAERASWEARYDKAPEVITDVLASIAAGTAVPVRAQGEVGGDADTAVSEALVAEVDSIFSVKPKAV